MDVAHNFGECTPQEHRTGDGSYVPCSGTLLPYAMPKLLHDATAFDLLPPSVELNKMTICGGMLYCVHVDMHEEGCGLPHIVEGMWLSAELLVWQELLVMECGYHSPDKCLVHMFKAGLDLNMPSDSTQLTIPNKEQLRLAALHAARESWLQALCMCC